MGVSPEFEFERQSGKYFLSDEEYANSAEVFPRKDVEEYLAGAWDEHELEVRKASLQKLMDAHQEWKSARYKIDPVKGTARIKRFTGMSGMNQKSALVANTASKNKIKRPPFAFLLGIVDLLPVKYRQNMEQEISDLRLEYFESISENRIWRARCIRGFYYVGFGWSVLMWLSHNVKQVIRIVPKKD